MSLIDSPALKRLWEDAQMHPEWATTRLWEHLFRHRFFSNERWIVASQQPPTHQPGDLRRIDLVVEDGETTDQFTLLFVEPKRATATSDDVRQVEFQAYTAACAYAVDTKRNEPLWAMTCVGSRARLWIFYWDVDFLIPYVPESDGLAERTEYIEISGRHGHEIKAGLDYIQKNPRPPIGLLAKAPSPRPANATLPDEWHASEVEYLDAQRQQKGQGFLSGWPSLPPQPDASGSGGPSSIEEQVRRDQQTDMVGGVEQPTGSSATAVDQMFIDEPPSWVEVAVTGKDDRQRYECRTIDGRSLTLGEDWVLQDIQIGGDTF